MKITLSQYAGFCDGVERAYEIVQKAVQDASVKRPIFVLDSLVHNQEVVDKIEALGIKKISSPDDAKKFFRDLEKNEIGTLVITAHGSGPEIYDLARKKGINIIDTTCPKVAKVQRLAKIFSQRGDQVIIIGEKNHKEVEGIFEWSKKKAFVVENEAELSKLRLNPKKKIVVISQTTQNQELVNRIVKSIKKKYLQVDFINTLCLATQNRQSEIRKMAKINEAVIVIGSSQSANSTHLWEISKEINPKSYFVEKAKDLKKIGVKNIKKIGVSAGASTPSWIIDDVLDFLGA